MKNRHKEIIKLLETNTMMRIDDLCERLSVSRPTIRRDLNELQNEGVERVGGAAFLNKTPRPMTAHNPARFTGQIGCIISVAHRHMHPYFSPILEGIEKELANLGYSLAFIHNLDDILDETTLIKILDENKINGMIVVEGIKPEMYEQLKKQVPFIVGIDISDDTVPVIAYDRIRAASSAVKHLLEQGHKDIGFIGGTGLTGDLEREKRYRGYKYALQEAGLEVNPNWVINTGWDVNISYNSMLDLLDQHNKLPTAMFAASDMMAISAIRAVTERKLRIPEDIAFIGLDNIEISQYTTPPLSSVHIPKYEMGKVAAKVLVDFIQGNYTLSFKVFMPHEVIVRQSSVYRLPNNPIQ
jgi:LacI family transcriptional regulator